MMKYQEILGHYYHEHLASGVFEVNDCIIGVVSGEQAKSYFIDRKWSAEAKMRIMYIPMEEPNSLLSDRTAAFSQQKRCPGRLLVPEWFDKLM
jgi:hypothetical protein